MIKRVVIAGCRDYSNYEQAKPYIDFCLYSGGTLRKGVCHNSISYFTLTLVRLF